MNRIQCLDLPESRFSVLWILFVSGYSAQFYQRGELLHFGHCPYLVADNILGKLSEYLYTDIFRDWILKESQD